MLGLFKGRKSEDDQQKRFGFDELYNQITWLGHSYPLGLQSSMPSNGEETIDAGFLGIVDIYRTAGPVFSCIAARMTLLSEARFQFQRFEDGRPAELYGNRDLRVLEKPWVNGTTRELISRAEQDVSISGNSYVHRLEPTRLRRLRPDWVTIVLGSRLEVQDVSKAIDAQVVAYVYEPPGEDRVMLMPEEVAHWSPIPDPVFNYRGMSWIPAAISDIQVDRSAVRHRQSFFNNSATPNFVVLPDKEIGIEEFKDFRDDFNDNYAGALNAWKTLFMGGGSDIRVLGMDFEKMDYRATQGAGETRIASAARVPPIVAGFSEGLQAATYSNYGQARRAFGDQWARPQWGSLCGAWEKMLNVPGGSRLWYDDRDVPALREDLKDEAEILSINVATIGRLIDSGYEPDAAVKMVKTGNLGVLVGAHSGLVSVQLNPISGESSGQQDDAGSDDSKDKSNDDSATP